MNGMLNEGEIKICPNKAMITGRRTLYREKVDENS
jgi:hypothetical protein